MPVTDRSSRRPSAQPTKASRNTDPTPTEAGQERLATEDSLGGSLKANQVSMPPIGHSPRVANWQEYAQDKGLRIPSARKRHKSARKLDTPGGVRFATEITNNHVAVTFLTTEPSTPPRKSVKHGGFHSE